MTDLPVERAAAPVTGALLMGISTRGAFELKRRRGKSQEATKPQCRRGSFERTGFMKLRNVAFCLAVVPIGTVPSQAGPCTRRIHDVQIRIDARLDQRAAAGPSATEGPAALLGQQPTPASMAAAELRLGDVSPATVNAVRDAMTRARRANLAGNEARCRKALVDAERMMKD
jgi:hypothetical protein